MATDEWTPQSESSTESSETALSSRERTIGQILTRMYQALEVREPEPEALREKIRAWDEALTVIPETALNVSYRRAYEVRMSIDAAGNYPLNAVEVLRAYRLLTEEHERERQRFEAERQEDFKARFNRLSYRDKVADVSRRAADLRREHPGRYETPITAAPASWEQFPDDEGRIRRYHEALARREERVAEVAELPAAGDRDLPF